MIATLQRKKNEILTLMLFNKYNPVLKLIPDVLGNIFHLPALAIFTVSAHVVFKSERIDSQLQTSRSFHIANRLKR